MARVGRVTLVTSPNFIATAMNKLNFSEYFLEGPVQQNLMEHG